MSFVFQTYKLRLNNLNVISFFYIKLDFREHLFFLDCGSYHGGLLQLHLLKIYLFLPIINEQYKTKFLPKIFVILNHQHSKLYILIFERII